jgi:hypothetical protein
MIAVRAAGIPAPRVFSCGLHPESPHAPISILMTRLPGQELGDVYDELHAHDRDTIIAEVSTILDTMRSWTSPWGERICSISGGSIRSIRVPNPRIEPCESEQEFHGFILSAASTHSFSTEEQFQQTLATARRINDIRHRVVFTHGDFAVHNILVHRGHVSGMIDWESAGWYPEYWEFTTPLRWPSCIPASFIGPLVKGRYEEELEAERAIMSLTIDSWVC